MPHIFYIHGAFSSAIGFTRIIEKLPDHTAHTPEYTVDHSLESIILDINAQIVKLGKPVTIVGHSLGGVIAVAISHINPLVTNVVTMSSPFGGSKAADVMKWFNHHIMFESICTTSATLRRIRTSKLQCPVTSIITNKGGNPMFTEPNDGVVTVASQLALAGSKYVTLSVGHSEVLLTDDAVKITHDIVFAK